MGCFGINGAISKLPIVFHDECILFIGLNDTKQEKSILYNGDYISAFTPIALPIYGTYDDYGLIDNIKHDENVEIIENFFNCSIEDIIRIIDDKNYGRYQSAKEKHIYNSLKEKIDAIDIDKYELSLCIDHSFIYQSISEIMLQERFGIDINASLEYTKEVIESEKQLSETEDYISSFDKSVIANKIKIKKQEESKYNIINISPNYNVGLYYFYDNIMLYLYKGKNADLLFSKLSEQYILFIKFYLNLRYLDWPLLHHVYSGQDGEYNLKALKDYYKKILSFIEKSNFE